MNWDRSSGGVRACQILFILSYCMQISVGRLADPLSYVCTYVLAVQPGGY